MDPCIIYASDDDMSWMDEEKEALKMKLNRYQMIRCLLIMRDLVVVEADPTVDELDIFNINYIWTR